MENQVKVIESIRYNRTGEVNDAVLFDRTDADVASVMVLVMQMIDATRAETRRNLFTTVAIRVEF